MNHHYDKERGSALWFILLAVALLAALTVTISRSSDTTEQAGTTESARIRASDVMRYAAGVEKAVERMRLSGASENTVSFANSFVSAYGAPGTVPESEVFHVQGGGLSYRAIGGEDWLFSGANAVTDVGTTANELLMILPVTEDMCTRIDAELGISSIPTVTTTPNLATVFTGSFAGIGAIDEPAGEKTACTAVGGAWYFYHTLIER